ncbi:hypothetical protein FXV77_02200 [Sphingobacterium phlebotomi]|uniref:Uncharacterized protein n=1 Tax=Sphingobacterium phlebotomi TaxID=2605433 RepID=A0A5D4HET3_9SPHI|nr:hypothetical protein [Sphingobacterium phlebotomi]TYR38115.1 hypothetical protein FXV77_02200 [Sphingobacterium phlebotomi]
MNTELTNKDSYSGMMYANDFKQWYTYLKKRLDNEWSAEDLSFLLGKPPYYYADFERMYKVGDFLAKESILLDRIYRSSCTEKMVFYKHPFEVPEERLVRLTVKEDKICRYYEISLPWEFDLKKASLSQPSLVLEEWKKDGNIQMESDMLLHVRLELEKLLKYNFFKVRQTPIDIFERIKKTELYHHRIRPQHVKQGIYLLIQQAKIVVRSNGDRYCFYEDC